MTGFRLSRESRIVHLAGARQSDELRALLRDPQVDWLRLYHLAVPQKAAPAVSRALDSAGGTSAPDTIIQMLRRQRMVSDFHMLHLQQRLRETLARIRAAGCDVMLLKGSALGATVYDSFLERPMADIDLLVRREDARATVAALTECGWMPEVDPARASLYQDHHHLPPFRDAQRRGLRLDLHLEPFPGPHPFVEITDELWGRAERANDAYSRMFVPARTHMILFAAVHLAWSHLMSRGGWRTFRDLRELVTPPLDWSDLVGTAERWNMTGAAYWTLRLARNIAAIPVPDRALRSLRPVVFQPLARVLERHFVAQLVPGELNACPSVRVSRFMWELAMRSRLSSAGSALIWAEPSKWTQPASRVSEEVVQNAEESRGLRSWLSYLTSLATSPARRAS